jgi:CcmD family protein
MKNYMWAAYIVTWVVHIAYLLYLSSRARRIRQEAEELKK